MSQGASFADLNGDCLSDLVVPTVDPESHSLVLEVWLNGIAGFTLDKLIPLPDGTLHYLLNDFGIPNPKKKA